MLLFKTTCASLYRRGDSEAVSFVGANLSVKLRRFRRVHRDCFIIAPPSYRLQPPTAKQVRVSQRGPLSRFFVLQIIIIIIILFVQNKMHIKHVNKIIDQVGLLYRLILLQHKNNFKI